MCVNYLIFAFGIERKQIRRQWQQMDQVRINILDMRSVFHGFMQEGGDLNLFSAADNRLHRKFEFLISKKERRATRKSKRNEPRK